MISVLVAATLWYFPGFGSGELSAIDKERLQTSFSADQVVCKHWCLSYATWEESVAKVNSASQSVVLEIQSHKPDERKDIVLVGHSLGGRVVAYSLSKLGELGIAIQTAVLLAPAISSGDLHTSKMYRGCSSIILVVGENDLVLKWIYPFVANGTSAIATIDDLDDETKYLRYVVPDQYVWRQNRLFPSHNASVYIEYLELARNGVPISPGPGNISLFDNCGRYRFVECAAAASNDLANALDTAAEAMQMSLKALNRQLSETWR